MGATSVTGVGPGSARPSSQHQTLGVNHLIGPRWNEEKEKEFQSMKKTINRLWWMNFFASLALFCMAIAYVLSNMSR